MHLSSRINWAIVKLDQFFGLDESRGSFWATFTFSTFLPEHSFMLKSYRVGWGGVVVAHVILVSAQVPLVLTLGLWTLGLRTWAWQFPIQTTNNYGINQETYSIFLQSEYIFFRNILNPFRGSLKEFASSTRTVQTESEAESPLHNNQSSDSRKRKYLPKKCINSTRKNKLFLSSECGLS